MTLRQFHGTISGMAKDARQRIPRRCIEQHPTHRSVRLNGRYISLTDLSIVLDWPDNSYLCLIFQGKRKPSLDKFKQIADALMMDMDSLQEAIEDRRVDLEDKKLAS